MCRYENNQYGTLVTNFGSIAYIMSLPIILLHLLPENNFLIAINRVQMQKISI